MPRRKPSEPTVRKHLHIFESDYEFIDTTYGHKASPSVIIRSMIRGCVNKIRANQTTKSSETPDDIEQLIDGDE